MMRTFKHFEWPDDYYIWLCDLVDLDAHSGYSNLISFLYDTEFVWSVAKDANRAGDGRQLREDYIYEVGWGDCLEPVSISCLIMTWKPAIGSGFSSKNWVFWSTMTDIFLMKNLDHFFKKKWSLLHF